ncbi:hypothetical protein BU24DRAFT_478809 [Aaosphaeria arxii CBS 175.79]|uniref:Uncharacterized protein n=1 Tax=Aaosphaeria arxii CBS 175.79 TaxID=1450172 RepID=A0A6A5XXK5_9PLEO|nr:uncharacterized protein BU24DRAFT_478809 [Aaosphaeria arxii CBS 175.79]KAF2017686.1 hypothetical protein BU24DRAFT_478809 [Aaosphaeria arxii CBS 175.79]
MSQSEGQGMESDQIQTTEPRATVVMPLYIYPLSDETWRPLYDSSGPRRGGVLVLSCLVLPCLALSCLASHHLFIIIFIQITISLHPSSNHSRPGYRITAHPAVDFLVVVNPNSGPGDKPLPGHDYEREVPKLNALPNVYTVGYIRIDYCRKPLHDVCEEIDRYAGWAEDFDQRGLGVKGIFVDETPNHYSAGRALYLEAVHKHIRATPGILEKQLILHNPGTPPDAGLADPGPDVIFTSEEPYERYRGDEVQKRLREYPYEHARSAFMISAVPKDEIQTAVRDLRKRGRWVFATDLVDDFYESFGESWNDFIAAMEPDAE